MRIVSWNCCRKYECHACAAELSSLQPDIAVLQECSKPSLPDDEKCQWFGNRDIQGVGVVTNDNWRVSAGPIDPLIPDSTYPIRISGPSKFHMLAVWAQKRPTYVRAILAGLDHYRSFLETTPSIIVGDFNSHSRWDQDDRDANHTVLVRRLREEFGLVSAFHHFSEKSGSAIESPTFYWYWHEDKPFHIDYCFVPERWADRIRNVSIGSYGDWAGKSDHRPLLVDVDME